MKTKPHTCDELETLKKRLEKVKILLKELWDDFYSSGSTFNDAMQKHCSLQVYNFEQLTDKNSSIIFHR